jgi:hypothetical protein
MCACLGGTVLIAVNTATTALQAAKKPATNPDTCLHALLWMLVLVVGVGACIINAEKTLLRQLLLVGSATAI